MDIEFQRNIRKWIITALFFDNTLRDMMVLKGGNAIDIVYNISARASADLDFSINKDFTDADWVKQRFHTGLSTIMSQHGYGIIDLKLQRKPETLFDNQPFFWKGYVVEFKIVNLCLLSSNDYNSQQLSRRALVAGPGQRKTFKVDISAYEYCDEKCESEINNFTIFAYTPEMLVFEKLRAICQQMEEYADIVPGPSRSPRAKDFFDIFILSEHFKIDFALRKNHELCKKIFRAKRVPLSFINKIEEYKEYHRDGFSAVRDTVEAKFDLQTYDYYFDYVVGNCLGLKTLWVKQSPPL